MMFKVAQESSTEALKSSENDLKMKNVYIHKTIEKSMKTLVFQAPKANWELRFASKRLLASDFEALEVSGTPRGDQESLKEVSKSSKVTIHRACRVILSSPGEVRDIGPSAMGLRPPFGPSNICRRRGPLKLMSKLIS